MQFSVAAIQTEIDAFLASKEPERVAMAHNLMFEQCVSAARMAEFETFFPQATAPALSAKAPLIEAQARYFNFIRSAQPLDHPIFSAINAESGYGALDEGIWLIRLEDVTSMLSGAPYDCALLDNALKQQRADPPDVDQLHLLHTFVDVVNRSRTDERATFVAQESELKGDLGVDWVSRIRTRLGLAHYKTDSGPRTIAMFRYQVSDVKKYCDKVGFRGPLFTKPTVIDQGAWPYFFPAPKALPGGRCLPLKPYPQAGGTLVCELLHPRINYQARHFVKIAMLSSVPDEQPLHLLRNSHLAGIRKESGDSTFGLEMDF